VAIADQDLGIFAIYWNSHGAIEFPGISIENGHRKLAVNLPKGNLKK
jgi:hypothetical protein